MSQKPTDAAARRALLLPAPPARSSSNLRLAAHLMVVALCSLLLLYFLLYSDMHASPDTPFVCVLHAAWLETRCSSRGPPSTPRGRCGALPPTAHRRRRARGSIGSADHVRSKRPSARGSCSSAQRLPGKLQAVTSSDTVFWLWSSSPARTPSSYRRNASCRVCIMSTSDVACCAAFELPALAWPSLLFRA